MNERTPPLTALRAFEAAARHLSFAQAAAELNVTPAALSFQIKSLEAHLGRPVFRRLNRAVELTEIGKSLAPGVRDGFDTLNAAWRTALQRDVGQRLSVTAGPAFTAKWLAPRLFVFAQAHPEIELSFTATLRLMDLEREEIDVAIRYGHGSDDGLHAETIITEWATPMMTPELAQSITTPEKLRDITLFHQDDIGSLEPRVTWQAWFSTAGLGDQAVAGPHFSQSDHAMDAALSGAGAVLGRVSLASPALLAGQLVAPFPLSLMTDAAYRLVCPAGTIDTPTVAAFRDWLLDELAPIKSLDAGRTFVHPPEN